MKLGEIRVRPDGGFAMMTPTGIQDVTLRCTTAGVVEVEEVASQRGLPVEALAIAMTQPLPSGQTSVVAEVQRQRAERRRA